MKWYYKIRWPYRFRWIEWKKLKVRYIAGGWYKIDCLMENLFIKSAKLPENGLYDGKDRLEKVIVSLTSFPQRMEQAYYAIKSLMIQTQKADRIILWLAQEQFPDGIIPDKFKKLIKRGLEIRFTPLDLRSHKKYYYILQEQLPNELVITFDDDIIYEADAVEKLLIFHQKYPECIVCNRGETIRIDEQGHPKPYKQWVTRSDVGVKSPSMYIVPSTGAGCLYPYGVMPPSTFVVDDIKRLAFTADDLWMRFNSIQNGIKVIKTRRDIAILCTVSGSQQINLSKINCIGGENDAVIARLFEFFPNTLKKLQE